MTRPSPRLAALLGLLLTSPACPSSELDDDDSTAADDDTGDDDASTDDDSSAGDDDTSEPAFPAPCEDADLAAADPLADQLEQLGDEPLMLAIDTALAVHADLTVPDNVDLCFCDDGRLVIDDTVTVLIGGRVVADPVQVFEYGGEDAAVTGMVVETVYPQWWGAVADDEGNDTDALRYAGRWLSLCGGRLDFVPGVYVVGEQSLAGAFGVSTSWPTEQILTVSGCVEPVEIVGNGAVLRAADGLRIGSFDPITGEAIDPVLPFMDYDFQAHPYWGMIQLYGNTDVTVSGFELDGNIEQLELGGLWGDTGRQCAAYGIWAYDNIQVHVEDVWTHHHGLDGLIVGNTGLTEDDSPTPHSLDGVISEYNARQGLSWVGGIGLTATDCAFNHTGKARFNSGPGAGLDIEAEAAVIRDGLFERCEFVNNTGAGMVSTSGDGGYTTFRDCTFWGTTYYSLRPGKPQLRFEGCDIYGTVWVGPAFDDPADAPVFSDCHFEDLDHPDHGVYLMEIGGQYVGARTLFHINSGGNGGTRVEDSTIVGRQCYPLWWNNSESTDYMTRTEVTHGFDGNPDAGYVSVIYGAELEDVTFHEEITTPPANGWYISVSGVETTNVHVDGPLILWQWWVPGVGGVGDLEDGSW